jgi:RNA polymerase sigma-70 factor (ECF subfamily)
MPGSVDAGSVEPCKSTRQAPGRAMNSVAGKETGFDEHLRWLLSRCAAEDSQALQRIYTLVSPILFASIIRILRRPALAEEALQDVFISIWQEARQFVPSRGRPMGWMISIARYRAIDIARRERLSPILVAELPDDETVDNEPDSEGGLAAWRPSVELMQRCLAGLSAQQAQCLELAYVDGNSHEDIARLTGRPLGTVKSWIRRGLLHLRQCLADSHDTE